MGEGLSQLLVIAMVAVAVLAAILALFYPYIFGNLSAERRVEAIADKAKAASRQSFAQRFLKEDAKDTRRKQLQESLKQIEQEAKSRKKKLTIRALLEQAGLTITPRIYWLVSIAFGLFVAFVLMMFAFPWYVNAGAGAVSALGLPRWLLGFLRRRRQQIFLNDFADAIDVMVRSLKAGLPVSDAMKVIAAETGEPVGPEFLEVVEGQRIGITIDQGLERMYDHMPVPEVNFLAIVMAIQSKTGGNLAEALANLSKVLRDRKKMKAKIRAVSQEAKSSAAIIGALPFCIIGALSVLNPGYLTPLWETRIGNIMLVGSGIWMLTGILVMRKMINFDI
ncbi:MAG TPA: type II secretion system F family protein [Aestuariivirgaceae bacterium]|nr:type II secretion system F family protein [Aestuariivirgaceae bacterium]